MAMRIDHVLYCMRYHIGFERWRMFGMTAKQFAGHANIGAITDQAYSKMMRGKAPRPLLDILESELPVADKSGLTPKQALARHLGLGPDVFEVGNEDELRSYLARHLPDTVRAAPLGEDCLIRPVPLGQLGTTLSLIERNVIHGLVESLSEKRAAPKIVGWNSFESSGASFYAYAVAGTELPGLIEGSAYLIRPFPNLTERFLEGYSAFDGRDAFNEGLRQLALALAVDPHSSRTAEFLLEALERTNSILFVLNAELIPTERGSSHANLLQDLLQATRESGMRPPGTFPPVCLVGSPPGAVAGRFGLSPAREVIDNLLRNAANKRSSPGDPARGGLELFLEEWRRFCAARGRIDEDESGPRLAWARWFYSTREGWIFPIRIRQRAFLASNYASHYYFDPTAGWSELAGLPVSQLPIDIRLDLDETVVKLYQLPGGIVTPERRTINWIATSVYWLTTGAAQDLQRHHFRNTDLSMFQKAEQGGLVYAQDGVNGGKIYKAALVLKAVAQDHWMAVDPDERRVVHGVVAARLFDAQHDKATLNVEFPLPANWGRPRLSMLCETIRHLMRSVKGISPDDLDPKVLFPVDPFPNVGVFPEPPDRTTAAYARHAVNFAFGTIFWIDINQNSPTGSRHARKLARQHGAYGLAAELIQLMSQDGIVGQPHWALHPQHVPRYLREAAFSMLDVGEFALAHKIMTDLLGRLAEDCDLLVRIGYMLDLVVVLATMDDLASAEQVLLEASERFQDMCGNQASHGQLTEWDDDPHWHKKTDDPHQAIRKLNIRIHARLAHLRYLQGRIQEALGIYQRLEAEFGPYVITREIAHVYIAVLGADGKLDKALDLAITKRAVCYRNNYHHEELGFRIAEAHIKRKMGSLREAELLMDIIYDDILTHGCSERTHLAFTIEAGRVLMDKGRYVRAYSGYLERCRRRAAALRHVRIARTAHRLAAECLRQIPAEVEALEDEASFAAKVRKLAAPGGDFLTRQRVSHHEPRYAFGLTTPEHYADRLLSATAIEAALSALGAEEVPHS